MRDRRVIYDSEDEDEGFSPLNSPLNGPVRDGAPDIDVSMTEAEAEAETETEGAARSRGSLKEPTSGSHSTDPDFFKQIYEAQLQQDATAETIPDTAGVGNSSTLGSGKDNKDKQAISISTSKIQAKNNSSSITDPTLKSAKKRATAKIHAKDFASSVTTPSAPSAKQKDVYDFSLSDEERTPAKPAVPRSKAKKAAAALAPAPTKGKRERGRAQAADPDETATAISSPPRLSTRTRGSSSNQAIQIEDDESPRPARKKRKGTRHQHQHQHQDQGDMLDDVDLLVIPTTAEMDDPPDHLTSSQKQEYLRVSGYSEVPDTLNVPPPSRELPPASFFIAPPDYLTSSQKQEYLRVSGYSELDSEENREQPSLPSPKIPQTQGQQPQNTDSTIPYTTPSRYCPSAPFLPMLSSPHLPTPSDGRTQMDVAQPHSSPDELNLPAPEPTSRNTKRQRDESLNHENAQDDSWDSDKIGFHRETYVPRTSRRRSGADLGNVGTSTQPEARTGSARAKRQKKGKQHEPAQDESWDFDKVGFHRETYMPRPSRRRSRAVDEEEEEEFAVPIPSMPDTCPPGDASLEDVKIREPALTSSGHHGPQENNEGIEGLDREFLEAMPDDIRQEIISNHITQQSSRTSQASRTRGRGRPSGASSALQPVPEETPQPKKRGRKKKEQKEQEAPAMVEETGEELGPVPTATAKKKRGRPKKAEAVQPPPAAEVDETASMMETEAPTPSAPGGIGATAALSTRPIDDVDEAPRAPSKRGRKKKVVEKPTEPDEVASEGKGDMLHDTSEAPDGVSEHHMDVSDEREALRDISNTASQNGSTTNKSREMLVSEEVEEQKGVTPEPKAKETPRSASSTGQQGKVPLRVGLSKKSRITPLLKMIRK